MRQRNGSLAPVRKVAAGGIGGAISTILVWIIQQWMRQPIPAEVAAAITTVIVFMVGYLTPAGAGE